MSHVRAQIREFVRAKLITIVGLEQSVFIDSEEIPEDLEMPCVHVSLGDEDIEVRGINAAVGRKLSRDLQLTVDIYCQARIEAVLQAEGYAAAAEAKLSPDPRMGGLTSDLRLRSYTILRSSEGDQPITQMRLLWFITYFTNERDATVPA